MIHLETIQQPKYLFRGHMAKQKAISICKPINKIPVNHDSIEGMTPEKDKKVKGTFINIECPGQPAKVSGRLYKGMEYFSKVFADNEKCEIPLSIARFINERICHERHTRLLDHDGAPIKSSQPVFRYKFMIEQY
jgi:hypothetical protein